MRRRLTTLIERLGELILHAYRPVRFAEPGRETPITLEELKERCRWEKVVASGLAGEEETPLSVAGLRTSRLFPRHLLYRNREDKTVLLTEAAAVGLVQAELIRRAAAVGLVQAEVTHKTGASRSNDRGASATPWSPGVGRRDIDVAANVTQTNTAAR